MRALILMILLGLSSGVYAQSVTELFEENPNAVKQTHVEEMGEDFYKVTYYFASGETRGTGFIKDKQMTGKWNTYDINGELRIEGFFIAGKKNGIWKFYDAEGNAEGLVEYMDNRPVHRMQTASR